MTVAASTPRSSLRPVGATVYILALIVVTMLGIGLVAEADLLVVAAAPFGIALVLGLRWLDRRAELIGWAVFTLWLGSTYFGSSGVETLVLFVYFVIACLGLYWSSWFLAAGWAVHIVWDLVDRELPAHLAKLPHACMIYDGLIAAYLAVSSWLRRWEPAAGPGGWRSAIRPTAITGVILVLVVAQASVATAGAVGHWVVAAAAPLAVGVIGGLRMLGPKAELIGWGVFTGWMGMTYAHLGTAVEITVFLVVVGLAALGVFVSPCYLVAAWALHLPWNLVSRTMPMHYEDLPRAALIYEAIVLAYLVFAVLRKRFEQA